MTSCLLRGKQAWVGDGKFLLGGELEMSPQRLGRQQGFHGCRANPRAKLFGPRAHFLRHTLGRGRWLLALLRKQCGKAVPLFEGQLGLQLKFPANDGEDIRSHPSVKLQAAIEPWNDLALEKTLHRCQ